MRFSTMTRTYSVCFHPFHKEVDVPNLLTGFIDALSHGELFRLDMGSLKAGDSTALQWLDVEKAPFSSDYEPVMALAQNHIFFLNVPGVPAGSADVYVIHCESGLWRPPTPVDVVVLLQSTSSSLMRKPSRRLMGRFPQPMVRPPHSSTAKGYVVNVLYPLHSFHRIISASGTRSVCIHPG